MLGWWLVVVGAGSGVVVVGRSRFRWSAVAGCWWLVAGSGGCGSGVCRCDVGASPHPHRPVVCCRWQGPEGPRSAKRGVRIAPGFHPRRKPWAQARPWACGFSGYEEDAESKPGRSTKKEAINHRLKPWEKDAAKITGSASSTSTT